MTIAGASVVTAAVFQEKAKHQPTPVLQLQHNNQLSKSNIIGKKQHSNTYVMYAATCVFGMAIITLERLAPSLN